MRKTVSVVLLLITSFCSSLHAQTSNASDQGDRAIPAFITDGMTSYKEKGPDAAVKSWIAGSPIDGSTGALTQANNLRQIQDYYGAFVGYEYVDAHAVSASTKVFYFVLKYEKGPLFGRFVGYQSPKGWILASFDFNTKVEAIFPSK